MPYRGWRAKRGCIGNIYEFHFHRQGHKSEGNPLAYPRVEDLHYIMAFGQEKNLDLALKEATLNLLSWVQKIISFLLKKLRN